MPARACPWWVLAHACGLFPVILHMFPIKDTSNLAGHCTAARDCTSDRHQYCIRACDCISSPNPPPLYCMGTLYFRDVCTASMAHAASCNMRSASIAHATVYNMSIASMTHATSYNVCIGARKHDHAVSRNSLVPHQNASSNKWCAVV